MQRYLQSSAPEGSSLNQRQERTSTGRPRITCVRVESLDSGKVIYSGNRLKITIGYRRNKEILFPSFWINIFNYTSNSGLFRMTGQSTESLPDSLPRKGMDLRNGTDSFDSGAMPPESMRKKKIRPGGLCPVRNDIQCGRRQLEESETIPIPKLDVTVIPATMDRWDG